VRGDYCGEGFSQLGCRTAWRLSADVLRLNDVSLSHRTPAASGICVVGREVQAQGCFGDSP
jgi:hypothetical protein